MWFLRTKPPTLPTKETALPGRDTPIRVPDTHTVLGTRTVEPFPEGLELAMFGLGCFWGAERRFWQQAGVYSTQVGYAAGITPNPTYEETCSGRTGRWPCRSRSTASSPTRAPGGWPR